MSATLALLLVVASAAGAGAEDLVVDLSVSGNVRVETSAIRIHVGQQADDLLDEERVDADIKAIYQMGFFEQVWAVTEPTDGGVSLTYNVSEHPYITEIVYEGADELAEEDLEAASNVRPRTIFDPRKAWEGVVEMRRLYAEEAYADVDIEYALDIDADNNAVLTYTIDEGRLIRIEEIRFEGVRTFKPRKLRSVMATRARWMFSWLTGAGILNDEELATDVERLTAFYYDAGYVHVRIDEPSVVREGDGLIVTFRIREGPQFKIASIGFEGDVIMEEDELMSVLALETGEIFRPSELRDSIFSLTEAYGNLGYAFAEVVPLTNVREEAATVDIRFRMKSGAIVSVRRIEVRGNTKTRDAVVRREMRMQEGEQFSGTGLRQGRDRVKRAGFFDEVEVTSARAEDDDKVDIVIDVKEGRTGAFSAGAGFSSSDSFLANTRISERNLFGRGQALNFSVDMGSRRQSFRIGFTEPWFRDIPLSVGFDIFDTQFEMSSFTRGGRGFSLRASYPLWELGIKDIYGFSLDNMRVGARYRLEQARVEGLSSRAPASLWDEVGEHLTSSIRPSLIRSTIDHPFDPTRGSRQSVSAEFAGFGGETDFIKIDMNGRWFFPLYETEGGRKLIYSFAGNLGYGIGESGSTGEELPAFERYFPGGISTVRGFDTRSLGPKEEVCRPPCTGEEDPDDFEEIGGSQQLIFNNELIVSLFPEAGLKGVAFFDAGEAFTAEDGIDLGELRLAVGWGIRWLSPFGPVRVEIGYPLDKEEDEDSSVVLFSFGAPF